MEAQFAVISPSRALTQKFREVLLQRGISCPVVETAQHNALSAAQRLVAQGAKVIISRGNTAQLLRDALRVPVIDEKHTFFDCFLCYQKARQISDKIAFLSTSDGYTRMLEKSAPFLPGAWICRLNLRRGDAPIEKGLQQLVERGIQVAVGGLTLEEPVTKLGIAYVMTEADTDSVNEAINEALYQLKIEGERLEHHQELKRRYEMIQGIMNYASDGIFSTDRDGILTNVNENARRMIPGLTLGTHLDAAVYKRYFLPVICSGEGLSDELINLQSTALILNIAPIHLGESVIGTVATIQRQTDIQKVEQKIRRNLLASGYVSDKTFDDIIGSSPALESVKALAQRYAKVDSTVLILGQTGTGKEVFAQSIHNASARKGAPFVAINCAAFPSSILESELFGYVKGAFTGARNEGKPGVFELAHNGTIFLDEISETPPEVQLKLLRVIQERKISRLGDDKVISVNVRIVAASNKDLYGLVGQGLFREDFYYRICVLELRVPTLEERREDIPELACYFLQNSRLPRKQITDAALTRLKGLSWRGNIRQLSNVIERLLVMCDTNTITEDLLDRAIPSAPGWEAEEFHADLRPQKPSGQAPTSEREVIRRALAENGGNKERAAKRLGISTTTLWRRMKKIQEEAPGYFDLTKYRL